LDWAPGIPIEYANLGGLKVRCIKTGGGPNLVLLHTLRTQLDIFDQIIPEPAGHSAVDAFDYPGHGWSDIPKAAYALEDFLPVDGGVSRHARYQGSGRRRHLDRRERSRWYSQRATTRAS
jgi:pimeloyl-ACP methyl ester carboxylesterase